MNHAYAANPIRDDAAGDVSPDTSLDEGWIGALSRLGRLVMVLHGLATTASATDFRRLAFEALQAELPFDSGVWATGVMNPGPVLHSLYAHRQPPEMMQAWQKIAQHDTVLTETLKRPGHTLRATAYGPECGTPFIPEVREHARRFGMERVLATSFIDPLLGLVEGFSLYRADRQARFSEPERLLVQHALPQMVAAWRTTRLRLARCRTPLDRLTPREMDVASRFGRGLTYQEIAVALHISPATVRNHLANIYGTLDICNKVELAKLFA
jgi:DNA-binding CsgD family transcriptional regulator